VSRVERIGRAVLHLGDCREILPTLRRPEAIVSDPPYGQRVNTNVTGKSVSGRKPGSGRPYTIEDKRRAANHGGGRGNRSAGNLHSTGLARQWPAGILGDDKPFDPEHLIEAADKWLIWGAHKFGERLPRGRTLVWDKVPTGKVRDQGDGETALCSVKPDAPLRIYRLLWDGVCVGSAARHEVTAGQQREHPTQKPEALMAWCLPFLELQLGSVICDPYMGAGSTGIAAVKAGFDFIGIELEPLYFEAACRRIEDAQRQSDLFIGAAA
jgi:site-specific DNA-methyltransferase (adenine-specific)